MQSKYPLFLCEPSADGVSWSFWCPFCKTRHTHGGSPGHRCAHSHTDAGKAAFPQGYELRLDPRHQGKREPKTPVQ